MKKILLLLLLTSCVANAQTINFPDPAFKAALISDGYDTDADGNIQVSEVQSITFLDVSDSGISDLTGISSFSSLINLNCNASPSATIKLTTIDVSAIATLQRLEVRNNDISSAILNPTIHEVYLNMNQLTSFDGNLYPDLTWLELSGNQLTEFTMNGNGVGSGGPGDGLIELSYNNLSNLNLTGSFGVINLANNPNLQTIDLSQTTFNGLWFPNCPAVSILNIKNGYNQNNGFISEAGYPDQLFICVDDELEASIWNDFSNDQGYHWVVNPYCNFTPGGDYNTITGTALFDSAGNGCGIEDIHNNFIKINVTDGTNSGATFSTANGNYTFYTGAGNFTVTPQLEIPEWFNISPANAAVDFPTTDNLVSVNDFCVTPNGTHPDVEVVISSSGPPIPGSDITYKIVYRNKGNQTLSGSLVFSYDEISFDYVETQPFPSEIIPGAFTYNYSNLLPFENRAILATLNVDESTVNINDLLNCNAVVNPIPSDENPEDNVYNYQQVVVASFDPNNIICSEGNQEHPDNIGKYLHYMINFENIGTAPARNIVVRDSIDTSVYDINSLQLMNSSHNVDVRIQNNIVEYIFKNINLPSSISNPIGGHGNVLFKIKTLPTLSAGDAVTNSADIHFDYNAPVATNDETTTFNILKRQGFVTDDSVLIYPNPAKNIISIKANSPITNVALFDVQGRILQTSTEHKTTTSLDISDYPKGIYFVKITTEKGSKVEKLVKE